MTQTQTTAERIAALIEWEGEIRHLERIAAEIDALTADNAQANQQLVNGVAKIAELERQRDEARAKVIEVRDTLHHTNNEFAVILRERNDAHLALAEARAEVERLRLPAEAWEALETLRPMFNEPILIDAIAEKTHRAAIDAADRAYQAAAARVRVAKEGR